MYTSPSRKVFTIFNHLFFMALALLCIYPLWYVFIQSLSSKNVIDTFLIPAKFTLNNYAKVFQMDNVSTAMMVSVARTAMGTLATVSACMLLGYLFTKKEMPYRKALYRIMIVTMYVSGGLIPTYLVYKSYGLLNNFWVYVLPGVISAYYVILIKTFIEQLPAAVEESAMIDGAGTLTVFAKIILPMSMPIVATIAVYSAVGQWNSWFDNHVYVLSNKSLMTLQYMLYKYLNEAERLAKDLHEMNTTTEVSMSDILTPRGVRMTITVVTVIPVLFVYPFLQRYFTKGIMLGAIKG
jgi:ABC-type glycerol-3-phosphate transport system permease component